MPFCKIVYVKHRSQGGWRWQGVTLQGDAKASDKTYPLFYECVMAARANGYAPTPELKCR